MVVIVIITVSVGAFNYIDSVIVDGGLSIVMFPLLLPFLLFLDDVSTGAVGLFVCRVGGRRRSKGGCGGAGLLVV